MTQPRNTPNPGTSTRPDRSSKRVAHKRPLGILPLLLFLLLLLIIAGIVLALVLAGGDGDNSSPAPAAAAVGTSPSAPGALPVAPPVVAATPPATGDGADDLAAAGMPLVGLGTAPLQALDGQPASGHGQVQSVVSDEGFWVGTSTSDRVFVFLSTAARKGEGESPYQVRQGDAITLTGTVTPLASMTSVASGVTTPEGLAQLRTQGTFVLAKTVQLAP